MPEPIFMLPGPTRVPHAVAQAMSRPMVNHRGEGFRRLYQEVQTGLRPIFGTSRNVVIVPGSGTGAMESAAVNLLEPGEAALVVAMGTFGQRFAEICRAASLDVSTLEIEWGDAPTPIGILDYMETMDRQPKVVMVTHNETSTGICLDLEGIARSLEPTGALLVVDAVSSLGAVPVMIEEWGIDVVVAASQKALMTPPGLAIVGLSDRAMETCLRNPRPRYYWDWRLYERDAPSFQTPYTPALSQWYGLREALHLMEQEGMESVYARHRLMSRMTRAGLQAMGARPLGANRVASPTVTAFFMPGDAGADQVRRILTERYQVITGGGQGRLKGKVIRFGHMGAVNPPEILEALKRLGQSLTDSGIPVDIAAALDIAAREGGEAL